MSPTVRADLHVHTCFSRQSGTLPFLGSRDCYSTPEAVYRTAKGRGMDIVCVTDHDAIDGALALLDRRPGATDIIVGEEISCWFPGSSLEVHIAAYGMTEALHGQVQALRRNVFDVTACLRESGVFSALNHLLHFYRGQVPLDTYLRLLEEVDALEVRNGTMLPEHNRLIEEIAASRTARPNRPPLACIGGSDAHTLRRIGRTWTSAPGRTAAEFLDSLRRGLGQPGGADGGIGAVAGDAYGVVGSYVAALAGFGPRDLRSWRRAGCLAFAAVSLPCQFMPFVIAAARKAAEGREVARARQRVVPLGTAVAVGARA